ncbi:hypothetical protein KCTC52924_03689 [Arenibacter antarcticus]|uniref:SusD/RagB family nutrient-binding outer membrane lipoprotein n=1 Tax=Arenibacter antarcticus TaxID=2040469 RepID=A0ABW5VHQ8_9FLAO|nr:SusD/RagB family nutrient-binding outer membrane lipoprotein [Arenibacter sp. H213]MCM4168135.1 SusD/RagB family nutrient-binding outer membrane lipoprotein [Arenibacter sp. H213]
MLKNKFLFSTLLVVSIFFLGSCDSFLDVNSNPNKPINENLPLEAKLPAALVSTVNQEVGQINQIGAFWGGYWGTNNDGANLYYDLKTYNGPGIRSQRDGIPVWENGYNNILYFKLIEEEASKIGDLFYTGSAKIMQGWLFLRLVDFYNNIPFDQAASGNIHLNPVYESGQEVYKKSINLITDGILDVKASDMIPTMNHGDVLFGGKKDLWAKFGNTIKLRALIRQSEKVDLAYLQSEIASITSEGSGFLGPKEHALVNPGYLNTDGKLNPFWTNYYRDVQGNSTANHQNLRPTLYLVNTLKNLDDPRLSKIYQETNGEINGVIFGNPDAGNPEYARQNTSVLKGPQENNGVATGLLHGIDQGSILMTGFESQFLQAEAAYRGWIAGDVIDYYQNGILSSMDYLKVADTDALVYTETQVRNFEHSGTQLNLLIEQKWLALNSVSSIEAWNDYRRLGLPNFPKTAASGVSGRPLRLMYPETERGTNNAQVELQGSDMITENKIWWML